MQQKELFSCWVLPHAALYTAFSHRHNCSSGFASLADRGVLTKYIGMSYATLSVAGTDVYVSGKVLQTVRFHDMTPSCKGTGAATSGCWIIVTLEPWDELVAVGCVVLC